MTMNLTMNYNGDNGNIIMIQKINAGCWPYKYMDKYKYKYLVAMQVADHTVNVSCPTQCHRLYWAVSPWTW